MQYNFARVLLLAATFSVVFGAPRVESLRSRGALLKPGSKADPATPKTAGDAAPHHGSTLPPLRNRKVRYAPFQLYFIYSTSIADHPSPIPGPSM